MSSKVVRACALIAVLSILAELGGAGGAPVGHSGPWPIHNGLNHQPTQDELRALHQQDVTSDQAHEIDRLYDELLSTSDKILGRRPARAPLTGVVGWIGRSMNRQQPCHLPVLWRQQCLAQCNELRSHSRPRVSPSLFSSSCEPEY
jgi:hypothetical protein